MGRILHSDLRFAPAEVRTERRDDGTLLLRSPQELATPARAVGEWLVHWARSAPDRTFLAERKREGQGEGWRRLSYAQALEATRRVGQSLLARGLGAQRPVAILSENGIDHALVALGAMHVGVPVVPISPAYSLLSKDFSKLRHIVELVRPGLVFAADARAFGPALEAIGREATPIAELLASEPTREVDDAFAAIGPDTVAKILFTSGSTGLPKGVINTQRMLCANQQMLAQVWPFVEERPPVVVDWLPWNHTFGGNHNFHLVLRNGGTLHIDGGKPAPQRIETTLENLREVPGTMYFNVPRGYDLLLPHLESDAALRTTFFRDLDVLFYAAAPLPEHLWRRIEKLAIEEKGGRLAVLSAWGSTETAPLSTSVHFPTDDAGVIGLPVPGCELKLVPSAGGMEVRVKGPHVTPGYFGREDLTRAAFDEEGYYRTGDAVKFVEESDPAKGLRFDGRIAEDFKLDSGTWVRVGAVRAGLIAASGGSIQDAVITGHGRAEVGALVFLDPAVASGLEPQVLRGRLEETLRKLAQEAGSSTRPVRLLVMDEPPSIDANEITDKGYLNQRGVLERRAGLVERLYSGAGEVVRDAGPAARPDAAET